MTNDQPKQPKATRKYLAAISLAAENQIDAAAYGDPAPQVYAALEAAGWRWGSGKWTRNETAHTLRQQMSERHAAAAAKAAALREQTPGLGPAAVKKLVEQFLIDELETNRNTARRYAARVTQTQTQTQNEEKK